MYIQKFFLSLKYLNRLSRLPTKNFIYAHLLGQMIRIKMANLAKADFIVDITFEYLL